MDRFLASLNELQNIMHVKPANDFFLRYICLPMYVSHNIMSQTKQTSKPVIDNKFRVEQSMVISRQNKM